MNRSAQTAALLAVIASTAIVTGHSLIQSGSPEASLPEPIYTQDFEDLANNPPRVIIVDGDYQLQKNSWGIVPDPLDPENHVIAASPPERDDTCYLMRKMTGPYMVQCRALFTPDSERMGIVFNSWFDHGANRWLRWGNWRDNHLHYDHTSDNSSRWAEIGGDFPETLTWHWMKLMVVPKDDGTTDAFGKWWVDGSVEPDEWTSSYTLPVGGEFGGVGFYAWTGVSMYDDITLWDLSGLSVVPSVTSSEAGPQGLAKMQLSPPGKEDSFWEFSYVPEFVPDGTGKATWKAEPSLKGMSAVGVYAQTETHPITNEPYMVTKIVEKVGSEFVCAWTWTDPVEGETVTIRSGTP